jgi:hypothetical protein
MISGFAFCGAAATTYDADKKLSERPQKKSAKHFLGTLHQEGL